ncbi:MAG: hypothetical protein DRI34_12370 [Deltaproteobacteria bacterium]|nr:MAG: hypothetical protein DRI34_12370 [Deltaproteobacteria bacterium]
MVSPATLKKARRLARERGRRLPDFLSEVVVAFIDDTEGYRDSLRRLEQRLDTGLDLGTGGSAGWNREELHAR